MRDDVGAVLETMPAVGLPWVGVNTKSPRREIKVCHCHYWRFDECPNAGVAEWAREQHGE